MGNYPKSQNLVQGRHSNYWRQGRDVGNIPNTYMGSVFSSGINMNQNNIVFLVRRKLRNVYTQVSA